MIRGLYTAGAGMIAQQRRQEMLTNNLANVNTPGYKADQASMRAFPNYFIKALGTDHIAKYGTNHVGDLATGVYMQERTPDFQQGDINETRNNTDLALLQGVVPLDEETGQAGFLVYAVQDNQGDVRYTRNGNFIIDGEGFITNSNGNYILGIDGAPINVGGENFIVRENGEIFRDGLDGEYLGQIEVALIPDAGQLVKEGNGLLRYEGDNAIASAVNNDAVTYQVRQGFIERSNVDPARAMTEMMSTLRSFEANQQVLKAYDKSLEITVNQIGRIG